MELQQQYVLFDNCNLTTCRYNEGLQCKNKCARKECVELCMKVLCLEDEKNE